MANTSSTGGGRYVTIYILGNATSAIKAMRETSAAAKETESALSRAGGKFKSVGAGMTQLGYSVSRVSLPLALLGGYAIKSALDFEKSMNLVRVQAGGGAKEVAKLGKEVEKLSGKAAHGFGPNELAEALYPIASDGFKAAEAMKVLSASSAGAAIGQANLALTANALGGAIKTYGGGAKEANKDMNILNATVGFGKFKLEELDQALTSGFLVQAKKSGIGLKEIGTALDSLARKSIPPQVEATRLQKTLIQFGSTSGIAEKSLRKIGISHYQLAENLKKNGLISTLELIKTHLKTVGSGAEAEAIEGSILGEAFGRSKGSANVGALLQAIPEMKKIEAEKKHYNTLSEALATTEQKSYYKIKVAVAELKKGLIELGNTLIPIVIPAFEKLAKIVQTAAEWFSKLPKGVKDAATYFGLFVVVAGPMLIFFGNLIKSGGILLGVLGKLVKVNKDLAKAQRGVAASEVEQGAAGGAGGVAGDAEAAGKYGRYAFLGDTAIAAGGFFGLKYLVKNAEKGLKEVTIAQGGGGAPAHYGRKQLKELSEAKSANVRQLEREAHEPQGAYLARYSREREHEGLGNTPIVIENKVLLDGKVVSESVATHLRNHSQGPAATKVAEASLKNSKFYGARQGVPK